MSENIIKEANIKAKTYDERLRMRAAALAIDFYNGQQEWHMSQIMAWLYPETWKDIAKYITTTNIVKGIIEQKSILFQYPPEFEIGSKDKEASQAVKDAFAGMLDKAELWKKLIIADRYADLLGKVGLCPRWHPIDNRIVIDIITPDRCFVKQDPYDPTKAEVVYYLIDQYLNPSMASPMNVYARWDRDSYSEVQVNSDFQEIENSARPIGKKGERKIPNVYGEIPIVWISRAQELDSFWVDMGYPLIDAAINLNLRSSNLDLGLDYQLFSTLVTKGISESKNTITGATRRLDLGSDASSMGNDADAKYITPEAKLLDAAQIINDRKVSTAKESGLSADAFNNDSSKINSGYQLQLTQKEVYTANELKKEAERQSYIHLVELMIICHNESQDFQIPTDYPITMSYISRPAIVNPVETVTLHTMKIQAGLMSTADAIRENNPDLTQEEAIAEAQRIQVEQALIRGRAVTPLDLDAE